MALIKCEECGKEISDTTEVCIHCGCPVNNKKGNIKINFLKIKTFYLHYPKLKVYFNDDLVATIAHDSNDEFTIDTDGELLFVCTFFKQRVKVKSDLNYEMDVTYNEPSIKVDVNYWR